MRIWSLHPKYLDAKGLVALWRETLLAKHVLLGKTKGYKNHPQLERFKKLTRPVDAIDQYLAEVYKEAVVRNYNFDKDKIYWNYKKTIIQLTLGKLNYETEHLLKKLKIRDRNKYNQLLHSKTIVCHPIFKLKKGDISEWEIV